MNYEEIREKYNNVMFDERDMIEKFLKEQADIRYGSQMFEWALDPDEVYDFPDQEGGCGIRGIRLDKNKIVVFVGLDGKEYDCTDFCYGQLEKVIRQLPDVDELKRKNAECDLAILTKDCSLVFEDDEKFTWTENGMSYTICDVENGGRLSFDVGIKDKSESFGIWESLPDNILVKFANHAKKVVLHRSSEYKELMELLSLEENLYFNLVEEGKAGIAVVRLYGTDCTLDILDASRDADGNLTIYGQIWKDDDMLDDISLEEKDIRVEYLPAIIEAIKECRKQTEKIPEELVALTDEQEKLVLNFIQAVDALKDGKVGLIMDDDSRELYALNMEHVESIKSSTYDEVDFQKKIYKITDFVCPVTFNVNFLNWYWYIQDEDILAKFK